jgi:CRISPR-associated protein Csy2
MTTDTEIFSNTKWLVIPRMNVRGMNAQPAWWCLGAPGPMAAHGFAWNVLQAAQCAQSYMKGVALVWHHFDFLADNLGRRGGREPGAPPKADEQYDFHLKPHQFRAASYVSVGPTTKDVERDYVGGRPALSGQPTARCVGTLSVIIALDEYAPVDLEGIERWLGRARFSGGVISSHAFKIKSGRASGQGGPSGKSRAGRGVLVESWSDVLSSVRSGFAFVNRRELIEEKLEAGAKDPLDAFLECTQPLPYGSKEKRPSWLMPYHAGFHRITDIAERNLTRDGLPHAFVEPLVGLGQFVSIRQSDGYIPFWTQVTHDDRTWVMDEIGAFSSRIDGLGNADKPPAIPAEKSEAKAGDDDDDDDDDEYAEEEGDDE